MGLQQRPHGWLSKARILVCTALLNLTRALYQVRVRVRVRVRCGMACARCCAIYFTEFPLPKTLRSFPFFGVTVLVPRSRRLLLIPAGFSCHLLTPAPAHTRTPPHPFWFLLHTHTHTHTLHSTHIYTRARHACHAILQYTHRPMHRNQKCVNKDCYYMNMLKCADWKFCRDRKEKTKKENI